MPDYTLYYWPIAFRGQFIRAVLAHVNASWEEVDGREAIADLKSRPPAEQLVPYMGPPVLTDHAADFSVSQMPAILTYLGRRHGLIPADPAREAMTVKIVADANDILYEMTLYNGAQIWTDESWAAFRPRLIRWMAMFEETGRRHGLTVATGTLLGTGGPGIADLVTHILWHTMTARFPPLRPMLEEAAPGIAGLSDRIAELPEQAALRTRSDALYGDAWCGGQIEASLRGVLGV